MIGLLLLNAMLDSLVCAYVDPREQMAKNNILVKRMIRILLGSNFRRHHEKKEVFHLSHHPDWAFLTPLQVRVGPSRLRLWKGMHKKANITRAQYEKRALPCIF